MQYFRPKHKEAKNFEKTPKPCHDGIKDSSREYSHMSTYVPGFQSSSGGVHDYVFAELATKCIRVNSISETLIYSILKSSL